MNKPRTATTEILLSPGSKSGARTPMKRWDSKDLFGDAKELLIVHSGSEYRLRLTSQGKLILTK